MLRHMFIRMNRNQRRAYHQREIKQSKQTGKKKKYDDAKSQSLVLFRGILSDIERQRSCQSFVTAMFNSLITLYAMYILAQFRLHMKKWRVVAGCARHGSNHGEAGRSPLALIPYPTAGAGGINNKTCHCDAWRQESQRNYINCCRRTCSMHKTK